MLDPPPMIEFLELHACSVRIDLIHPTVPSSTRADTVVATATTKKINEQDAKNISKMLFW